MAAASDPESADVPMPVRHWPIVTQHRTHYNFQARQRRTEVWTEMSCKLRGNRLPVGLPGQFLSRFPDQSSITNEVDQVSELQDLLKDLPAPVETNIWVDDLHHMPDGNKDAGWQNCFKAVDKHDKDLCQAYREQIDTLLVFAGLFSAVVTAFVIESYQWLQDDPVETSAVLLRELVYLMAKDLNQTVMLASPTTNNLSHGAIVRINALWFISLCLSLAAALVGILCKQWLREYERDVGRSPEQALAVRRIRFQGLEYWKVGTIVTSVPIILQLALALFIVGIADLLWHLHPAIAVCVTVVGGLTLIFYLSTTFLPLIQYATICLRCCGPPGRADNYCFVKAFTEPQCAFKSAQAWLAIRLAQPVIEYCLKAYAGAFAFHFPPDYHALVLQPADSWVTFDINWTRRRDHIHLGPHAAYETLLWLARNLEGETLSASIWHCLWGRRLGSMGIIDDVTGAVADIGCVADAYPGLVKLKLAQVDAVIRTQSLCLQCTLRTDLSADMTVEQLLRIAPVVGVNSQWTQDALNSVVSLYEREDFRVSDDIAVGLLRLAELQTREYVADAQMTIDPDIPHIPFLQVARLIYRGSSLRGNLLPAMCLLAMSWLEVQPPEAAESMAGNLLGMVTTVYVALGYDDRGLAESPGVVHVSRLACVALQKWPRLLRPLAYPWTVEHRQMFSALRTICIEEDPDVPAEENLPAEEDVPDAHAALDVHVSVVHDAVDGGQVETQSNSMV